MPLRDVDRIRRIAITAMFSDDDLMDQFTLKGGNALRMVHRIGARATLDIDLSMEADFDDVEAVRTRVFQLLEDRFDSEGYVVFDLRFERRPPNSLPGDAWGGYNIEFKAISKELHAELGGDLVQIRKRAETVGGDPRQTTRFSIQISTFEYCMGRSRAELDDYTIYVYTPEMIAAEKLRAICQQLPGYPGRRNPTARAKDFYDIHLVLESTDVDLRTPENHELLRNIFAAKEVPLEYLGRLSTPEVREFHRVGWPEVVGSVPGKLQSFDYYYDAVIEEVAALSPSG